MTCIIGLEHKGKVFIGGDSASASASTISCTRLTKVFRRGPFLIGYTSSFRMGQLLQHKLNVRDQTCNESDMNYMVTGFVEAVRTTLKDGGYAKVSNNEERGGFFLVGYKGTLYYMQWDFHINSNSIGVDSTGSGEEYAMGAMLALQSIKDPRKRIIRSLEIAAELCPSVCGPFFVKSI